MSLGSQLATQASFYFFFNVVRYSTKSVISSRVSVLARSAGIREIFCLMTGCSRSFLAIVFVIASWFLKVTVSAVSLINNPVKTVPSLDSAV